MGCEDGGCTEPEAIYVIIMVICAVVMLVWGALTFLVIGVHIEQTENLEMYDGIPDAPRRSACFSRQFLDAVMDSRPVLYCTFGKIPGVVSRSLLKILVSYEVQRFTYRCTRKKRK